MKARPAIVQVLPAMNHGGVERGTLEIARAIVANGMRSYVISAGGRLVDQLEQEGSQHITLSIGKKSPTTLLCVRKLASTLKTIDADIVHVRSRLPAWMVRFALSRMKKKPRVVSTVHGFYSVSKYSAIMLKADRVIAVSDSIREYISGNYPGFDMQKLTVIHRGVDESEFPYGYEPEQSWLHKWYSEHPYLKGRVVLVLAGRLSRLKGHHDFITLIKALRDEGVDVHGLIVGGEEPGRAAYAKEVYQEVEGLGLMDFITFTGHRSDVREIYSQASIVYSLSSKPESFGRTVLEPLYMGVPVVGYAHGGVGEILSQLYPAGLVEFSDQEALIERTKKLIEDPVPVQKTSQFSLQQMQDRTIVLYREMLDSVS